MNRYNMLQAIYMSFYSKQLYRDVATNWGAKSFLYLLMLVLLIWIAPTYQVQHTLNLAYAKDSDKIVSQIPVITIKDGKVNTPEKRPYFISDPDTGEAIAIIDTTGQYNNLEQAKTAVLITQTEIISRSKPDQVRIDHLPNTLSLVVDPQVINSYVSYYLGFVWIFFFLSFVLLTYCYRIIQVLLYSIIGKIFCTICKVKLSYSQVMQIAMIALTPAIVLAAIFDFFNIQYAFQMFSYFILSMIYLFYGVKVNKD